MTLDGPNLYASNGVQNCEGGTIIIKRGTYTPHNHYVKTAPGGDIGERTAVNYVGSTAYYVRGPEDIKALSEINLATGKGAHP